MLESGPVGGFIAAARMETHLDRPNVIAFDMGGTTAKANLRSAPWSVDLPHSRFRVGHRGYNLHVWLLRIHAGPS